MDNRLNDEPPTNGIQLRSQARIATAEGHPPKTIQNEGSSQSTIQKTLFHSDSGRSRSLEMDFEQNAVQRSDLKKRSEIKFRFAHQDLPRLRAFLTNTCRKQQFCKGSSTVHSVYFDTPGLECCQANLSGISERNKLRVRWYDSDRPVDHFFLELKWRRNRATGKHRFKVLNIPEGFHFRNHSLSHLAPKAPEILRRPILNFWFPVSHVIYQREHYISMDQTVRFTVDWNIRFSKPSSGQNPFRSVIKETAQTVVLEAKTAAGNEKAISGLIAPIAGRVQRNSKYVMSCQHLGLLR